MSNWISHDVHESYEPNISICNQIVGIDGCTAQILDSTQIMKIVANLTNDSNLEWLFTIDVNMFKSMVATGFSKVLLPKQGDQRWGVFCINDAILTDEQRRNSALLNQYHGTHWYTVVLSID